MFCIFNFIIRLLFVNLFDLDLILNISASIFFIFFFFFGEENGIIIQKYYSLIIQIKVTLCYYLAIQAVWCLYFYLLRINSVNNIKIIKHSRLL